MKLWQRLTINPTSSLALLDMSFHLKFVAYRDRELREQLREAWTWCLKTGKPSPTLALRSNEYAKRFTKAEGA